jgi:hypothetical protein
MADYASTSAALIDKIKQAAEAAKPDQYVLILSLAQAYAEVRRADTEAAKLGVPT